MNDYTLDTITGIKQGMDILCSCTKIAAHTPRTKLIPSNIGKYRPSYNISHQEDSVMSQSRGDVALIAGRGPPCGGTYREFN